MPPAVIPGVSTALSGSETEDNESQNVIVAVRVRPPNGRELAFGGDCTLAMDGQQTTIAGPGKVHQFRYDHSFWSHNEIDSHFANQETVFRCMGKPLLSRAFEGYNCCLFAYGQTGSGKSYTMMGERGDKDSRGIIPRFSEEMWNRIATRPDVDAKVEISYFEIYAEQIYDLLVPASKNDKAKLKVREHPVMGPYVENLKVYPALSYQDIEGYMTLGSKYRATASTNMNATSSRSHAVFIINLTQTLTEHGEEHTKVSRINLIDLAGSERSDAAGTSGQRLREGSAINKSLHTLGKIISVLADKGSGKRKKAFVPYRDSVLTWILKDSLGGNSKTGMLATLSPSMENYAETLSTLRYAHQARSIVNEAKVNEDPNIALIRQLRSEIDAYRAQYGEAKGFVAMAEAEALREKLAASEQLMAEINRSWEEKLRQSERIRLENQAMLETRGPERDLLKVDNRQPNLVNLNEDPQLSEMLIYIIKEGITTIGKDPDNDIELRGVFVRGTHAAIHCSDEHEVMLTCVEDALVYINGEAQPNNSTSKLKHGDRVVFGNHHFFRLNIPSNVPRAKEEFGGPIKDYAFAREELERIQAEKIEAQLQAEHEKKTNKILEELDREKAEAQSRLLEQQRLYEERLKSIELEAVRSASQQQSQIDRAEKIAQEHIMALAEEEQLRIVLETEKELLAGRMREEKAIAQQQMEEEAAAKNKIIEELELEKKKIEEDLRSLKDQHETRRRRSVSTSSATSGVGYLKGRVSQPHASKKGDWLHISGLIAEANEISNRLEQNTVFRRLDNYMDSDDPQIKLHNTKLGISTTWTLPTFESRLEQIKIAYQQIADGTDGADSSAADELFYNPDDEWTRDSGPAALGWIGRPKARSMYDLGGMINAGPADTSTAAAFVHDPNTKSPALAATAFPAKPIAEASGASVPLLCRQYVKNSLSSLQSQSRQHTTADDIVEAASALNTAVDVLNATFTGDVKGDPSALCAQSDVRNATLSATMSMELLCSTIRALRRSTGGGHTLEQICDSLSTAAVNTGSSLAKLLQGIENGIAAMVSEACIDMTEDIKVLCEAAGELAIATAPVEENEEDEEDDVDEGDDPEEFAVEEEEATYASSSRMVRIATDADDGAGPAVEGGFRIDDIILAAFERGTRMHVHNSMARLTSDMADRAEQMMDMVHRLGPKSNVNAMIVHATSNVIKSTRDTFELAQQLQDALGNTESASQAKRAFYRKSFKRAKGIINEVRDMADMINSLAASCSKAVGGGDDVSTLMSNAKNLRAAVARLIHASEFKLGRQTIAAHQLNTALRNACSDVTRASKQLTSDCEEYNQSDEARAKRAESGGMTRKLSGSSFRGGSRRMSSGNTPMKTPTSEVQRRLMLVEQQSEVYRLETELADAQKMVKELQRSMYKVVESSNEDTTDI